MPRKLGKSRVIDRVRKAQLRQSAGIFRGFADTPRHGWPQKRIDDADVVELGA
jgi:hypothetical protein